MRVSVTPPGFPQSVDCQRRKGWRAGFATPRQVAVLPRHPRLKTRQVGFVAVGQNLHVNEADVGNGLRRVQIKQQLINELAAQTSVPDGEAFEFDQPFQVDAHLRQAPPASVAQFPAAKGGIAFALFLTSSRMQPSRRRVCGGNSSRERPKTSGASWLAKAMSSSVTSM